MSTFRDRKIENNGRQVASELNLNIIYNFRSIKINFDKVINLILDNILKVSAINKNYRVNKANLLKIFNLKKTQKAEICIVGT